MCAINLFRKEKKSFVKETDWERRGKTICTGVKKWIQAAVHLIIKSNASEFIIFPSVGHFKILMVQ